MKASDISWDQTPLRIDARDFRSLGDSRYQVRFDPAGVVIEVDRLRRERHELVGELAVRVNGNFPAAKTVEGILSIGDFNFSSVQARSTRAKLVAERSGVSAIDWFGLLEEFCVKVIKAERQGPAPVDLRTVQADDSQESAETWDIAGWPLLKAHPTILFGDGGSGKSLLAMYAAGTLAEAGVKVLYVDWEFTIQAHKARFKKLFRPEPAGVLYLRGERPMREEVDKINRIVAHEDIGFIICDSIGYACDGRPEEAERANEYFRAVRQLKVGTLHLAHVTKSQGGDTDQKPDGPFGSIYWRNGARSVWFLQAAKENPAGSLRFGLYQRKNNLGSLLAPRAYTLKFSDRFTTIERSKVEDVDELAAALPTLDRMRRYLLAGPRSVKDIAEDLNLTQPVVRATVARHATTFVRIGKQIGVKSDRDLEF